MNLDFIRDFIKEQYEKEPARFTAYGGSVAVALALKVAELLGMKLDSGTLLVISGLGIAVLTELIRKFVYAPATVQKLVDAAAATGIPDPGNPPTGEPVVNNPED